MGPALGGVHGHRRRVGAAGGTPSAAAGVRGASGMEALGRAASLGARRSGTRDRLRWEGQRVVATQAGAERFLRLMGPSCAERPPPPQHPCGCGGAGISGSSPRGLSPALGPAAVRSRPRCGAEVQPSAEASALTHRPLHFPAGPGAAASARPVAWTGGSLAVAVAALLLTGRGAALPPPHWCRPWRWSRRTESRGPGGGQRVSAGPCSPGAPGTRLLTVASCCPRAVRTPAASGSPGRRSILFPTNMSGSGLSVACGRGLSLGSGGLAATAAAVACPLWEPQSSAALAGCLPSCLRQTQFQT